jgi:asparagine synthetase B (glutamine-hydrolysing)
MSEPMIGIFALAGWQPTELEKVGIELARSMATNPRWDISLAVTKHIACGRIGPKRSETFWNSSDGVYSCWLDGFAYSAHSSNGSERMLAGAEQIGQSLLQFGPTGLKEFSGEFFVMLLDKSRDRLLAGTDHFGTRTTYWHASSRRLVVSSELLSPLRLNLLPKKLDREHLVSLLRYAKCRLGYRTLFQGIEVIPPGTVQEYDLRNCQLVGSHVYYHHSFLDNSRSEAEWSEDILLLLRQAVDRSLLKSRTQSSLALSGGLDSRLILGATNENQRKKLFLISYGMPESAEVQLARCTAERAGVNYENVNLRPRDYLDLATQSIFRNEEFDIFVQGAQVAVHNLAAERSDVHMSGWDLDIGLRGTYLTPELFQLATSADVQRTIDQKWKCFSEQELAGMLQEGFCHTVSHTPEEMLADLLSHLDSPSPLAQYLMFIFRYEKCRLLMLRNRMIRFELESATPLLDTDLQKILSGVPESLKIDNKLFAKILNRMTPELAALPYQRTMLPANVPTEYWNRGSKLEQEKEMLFREISLMTGRRIPYTRYYSNFDEWLTFDPDWMRFTDDLLSSKQTVLTQDILKPVAVANLINTHRQQPSSQMSKIIHLMSLELYLREYFS